MKRDNHFKERVNSGDTNGEFKQLQKHVYYVYAHEMQLLPSKVTFHLFRDFLTRNTLVTRRDVIETVDDDDTEESLYLTPFLMTTLTCWSTLRPNQLNRRSWKI